MVLCHSRMMYVAFTVSQTMEYFLLFTSAIDAANNLIAALHAGQLKQEMKKDLKPSLRIMDEVKKMKFYSILSS